MDYKLLWIDDEIDLLKGHIMFLEKKGYGVDTVTNGFDALEQCDKEDYDTVGKNVSLLVYFLQEKMND